MELWIRSQNKKRLYKANELFVEKDVYKDWCIETAIGHDYIIKDVWYICVNQSRLGKYFNEERALEVLDKIEQILTLKIENATHKMADILIKSKMIPAIYEMPKD